MSSTPNKPPRTPKASPLLKRPSPSRKNGIRGHCIDPDAITLSAARRKFQKVSHLEATYINGCGSEVAITLFKPTQTDSTNLLRSPTQRNPLRICIDQRDDKITHLEYKIKCLVTDKKKLGSHELYTALAHQYLQVTALNANVATVEARNVHLTAKVETLEAENGDLTAKVATLEQQNVVLTAKVETLEERNDALMLRVDSLETENAAQSKKMASMQEQIDELIGELKAFRGAADL